MISRNFLRSSAIYSLVGALPYASGFLLLPWFTTFLTPVQFGINALYITLMFFFQIIASVGLDVSAGVLYYDYKQDSVKLKRFIGTIFICLTITGFFTILIFSIGGLRLFNLLFQSTGTLELLPFGLFTVISAVLNNIFKTYTSLLINQERPFRFLWINLVNFIITIGTSLLLLYYFPFTLYGPVLGRLFPAIVSASITLVLVTNEYGFTFNKNLVVPIIRYCLPLFIYSFLMWIVNYVDRFIILRFMNDPTYVGIYDFGVKLALCLDLIIIGMISAVQPKVFNIWKSQNLNYSTVEVNRFYHGVTAIVLIIIPVFIILAPIVIPIFIKKTIYYHTFSFIAILSIGYATRIWFFMFSAPLMYFKKTKALPKIFLISALFQIVVGALSIKYFGIIGAVWTNFLVKPLQAFLLYYESRKIFHYRLNRWKMIYTPSIFIFIVLVTEILATDSTRLYLEVGQCISAFVLIYLAYRKEIIPFILSSIPISEKFIKKSNR